MIKSEIGGKECKDTMELRTTKSDGAGDEKKTWRVRIRTIGGKEEWRQAVMKPNWKIPSVTWMWATYVKDLRTGWYKLINTSMDESGRSTLRNRSQGAGWPLKGGWKKRVEGASWSRECYDRQIRSRLDITRCVYSDDVRAVVRMNNLFVVE